MPFRCFSCSLSLNDNKELVKHMRLIHENETLYKCHPEDKCPEKYRYNSVDSFRKHRLSKHILPSGSVTDSTSDDNNAMDTSDDLNSVSYMEPPLPAPDELNTDESKNQSFDQLLVYDLLLIFSILYSFTDMPRKRVQDIVAVFSENLLKGEAFRFIQKTVSANGSNDFHQILCDFANALDKYPTEYLQSEFLKKEGKFVEPESYKIGERRDFKKVGEESAAVSVSMKAAFVPLRQTLKSFFEIDGVLSRMLFYLKQLREQKNVISNFIQGEYWTRIQSNYKSEDIVLPLIIYFDEFEVNNPLGSHAGVNKVGAVYSSVPCLPIEFQSKLENIFLVLLFNVLDRKLTNDFLIFTKLVEELNFLESTGIVIHTIKHGIVKAYFKLAVIVGDNLGMHSIMGFSESFVANFPCRFCLVQKSDLGKLFHEKYCNLRTRENYEQCLKLNDVSKTGLKNASVFNSVNKFHIIEAPCVDAMHDILEGVAKYDLGYILHHYIFVKKYFTLEQLNQRVNGHPFDSNDRRSKPPSFTEVQLGNRKISLSSSEMLCFLNNITLMIGDFVPKNEEYWQSILLLRKITDIVFSTHFQIELPDYLGILIAEYLSTIKKLGLHFRPKHHYLIHYPSIMRAMGPLGKLSSMRFESRHHLCKIIANATTSRLNICKTIAHKNQLILARRLLKNDADYPIFELLGSPNVYVERKLINNVVEKVQSFKRIKFLGNEITVNKTVLLRPTDSHMDLLLVEDILQKMDNMIFVCKLLKYSYNDHYDAYEAFSGEGKMEKLNLYDLYECTISYNVFLNNQSYVPKRL